MSNFVWHDGGQFQFIGGAGGSTYAGYADHFSVATRDKSDPYLLIDDECASVDWWQKNEPQAFDGYLPEPSEDFIEAMRKEGINVFTFSAWKATATPELLREEREKAEIFHQLELDGQTK